MKIEMNPPCDLSFVGFEDAVELAEKHTNNKDIFLYIHECDKEVAMELSECKKIKEVKIDPFLEPDEWRIEVGNITIHSDGA